MLGTTSSTPRFSRLIASAAGLLLSIGLCADAAAQTGHPRNHSVAPYKQAPQQRSLHGVTTHTQGRSVRSTPVKQGTQVKPEQEGQKDMTAPARKRLFQRRPEQARGKSGQTGAMWPGVHPQPHLSDKAERRRWRSEDREGPVKKLLGKAGLRSENKTGLKRVNRGNNTITNPKRAKSVRSHQRRAQPVSEIGQPQGWEKLLPWNIVAPPPRVPQSGMTTNYGTPYGTTGR